MKGLTHVLPGRGDAVNRPCCNCFANQPRPSASTSGRSRSRCSSSPPRRTGCGSGRRCGCRCRTTSAATPTGGSSSRARSFATPCARARSAAGGSWRRCRRNSSITRRTACRRWRADELPMAARIDARDLFRFDPDSADVQFVDAGEVRQGDDRRREVILVAAGKQYVDQFIRALDRAGAVVASLEIDPTAVWRAAGRVGTLLGNVDPRAILLDIGAAQSRLVIGRGDAIRVIRTIDVGGRPPAQRDLAQARPFGRRGRAAPPPGGCERRRGRGRQKARHDAHRAQRRDAALDRTARARCSRACGTTPSRSAGRRRGRWSSSAARRTTPRSDRPSAPRSSSRQTRRPVPRHRHHRHPRRPADHCLGEWAVALGLALKGFRGGVRRTTERCRTRRAHARVVP